MNRTLTRLATLKFNVCKDKELVISFPLDRAEELGNMDSGLGRDEYSILLENPIIGRRNH